MHKVIIRNQVLNWMMGENAHVKVRVPEGESIVVDWGDNQISRKIGQKTALDFRHVYPKTYKVSETVVEIAIESEHILSVCDCSVDMDRISFDGSQAPSLDVVDALWVEQINVEGCHSLHTLNLHGYQGKELKLPELPSLKTLKLFGAEKLKLLNIVRGPNLEEIDIANSSTIEKISIPNNSHINRVIVSNGSFKNLNPKCFAILEATIARNGGTIVDFYKFLK